MTALPTDQSVDSKSNGLHMGGGFVELIHGMVSWVSKYARIRSHTTVDAGQAVVPENKECISDLCTRL